MIKSMTGYGKGICTLYNRKFTVEIKSVNHRYCDISTKLPHTLSFFEDKMRKMVSEYILRGKVDIHVGFETLSKDDVYISFNEALADAYISELTKIKEKYRNKIVNDISVSLIASFPDVITIEKGLFNQQTLNEVEEAFSGAVSIAIEQIVKMRCAEGLSLKQDILAKLEYIFKLTLKVKERSPLVVKEHKEKLQNRLNETLGSFAVDENRLVQEITIFADKSCVDEEIIRLLSHINQMKDILNETTSVGRKLEFLVQEMNREVNTIGSKSNDLEITKTVIDLKTEIEKIREQVQNIE